MPIPVFFFTSAKDFSGIENNARYLKDAFRAYKLNVVADRSLEGKILELGMGFVDENEVCPGLNKKKIGEYLQGRIKDGTDSLVRSGNGLAASRLGLQREIHVHGDTNPLL